MTKKWTECLCKQISKEEIDTGAQQIYEEMLNTKDNINSNQESPNSISLYTCKKCKVTLTRMATINRQ